MIREAILAELERQGISRYALAKKQTAVHKSTCLSFLYSGRNVNVETAAGLLEALDLKIVPAGELQMLRLLLKTTQLLRRKPSALGRVLADIADASLGQAKGA